MSTVIGNITSLGAGKFFAKGPDGFSRELSEGNEIYQGEIVAGSDKNELMDSITVHMQDGSDTVVYGDEKQLFDESLAKEAFAENETVTDSQSIDALLAGDAETEGTDNANLDDLETAAGQDSTAAQTHEGGIAHFLDANNGSQDVEADLRERGFNHDQVTRELPVEDLIRTNTDTDTDTDTGTDHVDGQEPAKPPETRDRA